MAANSQQAQRITRGANSFPYALEMAGAIITVFILLESFLQLTDQPFSFVKFLNQHGYTSYKPSKLPNHGIWHLTGWIGSACFVIMMLYSVRKRFKFMVDKGSIRYWLDFHMFLGIVGTVLVTVHSTYKFGGIVALSYWSAVLVAVSGFLGRYLYIHIPRSVTGNELRMDEIDHLLKELDGLLDKYDSAHTVSGLVESLTQAEQDEEPGPVGSFFLMLKDDIASLFVMRKVWSSLKNDRKMPENIKRRLYSIAKEKRKLVRSRRFLEVSRELLHYWHVFHKPFAIIMFIVMFLHVAVFYVFKVA